MSGFTSLESSDFYTKVFEDMNTTQGNKLAYIATAQRKRDLNDFTRTVQGDIQRLLFQFPDGESAKILPFKNK